MAMAAAESALKLGVPQPVAGSQPLVAVKQLLPEPPPVLQPEVTSLNAALFWR